MELLVLGGTSFAGRHVVEQALLAGHNVTTFNRGRTDPGIFPDVRSLRGDRASGDYTALNVAGPFDAVVDMCAYVPRAVREVLAALRPGALNGPYILISSVSVYAEAQAEVDREGFTEESALARMPNGVDHATEDVTGETYGPLKALTEEEAKKHHSGWCDGHPPRPDRGSPRSDGPVHLLDTPYRRTAARYWHRKVPTSPGLR